MNREEYEYHKKLLEVYNALEPIIKEIYSEIENCIARLALHAVKQYFTTFKDEKITDGKIAVSAKTTIEAVIEHLKSNEALGSIIDKMYEQKYIWEELGAEK